MCVAMGVNLGINCESIKLELGFVMERSHKHNPIGRNGLHIILNIYTYFETCGTHHVSSTSLFLTQIEQINCKRNPKIMYHLYLMIVELYAKSFEEGYICGFDLSLEKHYIKSSSSHHVSQPILKVE